jgi:hypothetical protein
MNNRPGRWTGERHRCAVWALVSGLSSAGRIFPGAEAWHRGGPACHEVIRPMRPGSGDVAATRRRMTESLAVEATHVGDLAGRTTLRRELRNQAQRRRSEVSLLRSPLRHEPDRRRATAGSAFYLDCSQTASRSPPTPRPRSLSVRLPAEMAPVLERVAPARLLDIRLGPALREGDASRSPQPSSCARNLVLELRLPRRLFEPLCHRSVLSLIAAAVAVNEGGGSRCA